MFRIEFLMYMSKEATKVVTSKRLSLALEERAARLKGLIGRLKIGFFFNRKTLCC